MNGHDLLTMYSTKLVEYLIAVSFLVLFVPFWRFLNAAPAAEREAEAPGWLGQVAEWFHVPEHVYFHPGHAWARVEGSGLVKVGMDDFARKLVGRACALRLPAVGARLRRGEPGWSLVSNSTSIDMLAPVDGTVVAVNDRALKDPDLLDHDPYGAGWLMKLRAPAATSEVKQLLSGNLARHWMEEVTEGLHAMMSPELGRLYQDGGLPVDGMARGLDAARWDEVARRFFLTSRG
jgi:glycine cleavage system H protein